MRGYVLNFDGLPHPAAPAEVLGFDNLDLGDTFEIEFKVRYRGPGATPQTILDKGAGAYQVRRDGTKLQLAESGGLVFAETSSGALTVNRWHNVILWKDGATSGILVDQRDRTAVDGAGGVALTDNTGPMTIGCTLALGEWFKGHLKDLRFWDAPRSDADRARYAYRPLIPEMANLRAWWPIFEGEGTRAANVTV